MAFIRLPRLNKQFEFDEKLQFELTSPPRIHFLQCERLLVTPPQYISYVKIIVEEKVKMKIVITQTTHHSRTPNLFS